MSVGKRMGKGLILVVVALLCIAWFASAAWIGMAKHDEWYGGNTDGSVGNGDQGGMVDMGMVACIGDEDDQPVLPCYYDATTQGNGQGRSYTMDITGHVTYWDTEY